MRRGVAAAFQLAEYRENLVQQPGQTTRAVEQARDRAEQIAEQVAGAGLGGDVQDDATEIDLQAEQIERDRSDVEVQYVAGGRAHGYGQCDV